MSLIGAKGADGVFLGHEANRVPNLDLLDDPIDFPFKSNSPGAQLDLPLNVSFELKPRAHPDPWLPHFLSSEACGQGLTVELGLWSISK